jgi:hypothetical protein
MKVRYLAFGLYYHDMPGWYIMVNLSNVNKTDTIPAFQAFLKMCNECQIFSLYISASNIEAEGNYIAILHDVFFPFQAQTAG